MLAVSVRMVRCFVGGTASGISSPPETSASYQSGLVTGILVQYVMMVLSFAGKSRLGGLLTAVEVK